jgi:hypothetical protein
MYGIRLANPTHGHSSGNDRLVHACMPINASRHGLMAQLSRPVDNHLKELIEAKATVNELRDEVSVEPPSYRLVSMMQCRLFDVEHRCFS